MPELSLSTTAGDLSRHLSWVARSLPTRPTIPVLAGIRLDITETELGLTATDYEVWASATLDCKATGSGSWLLPGRVLTDLVARMDAHQLLTLTHDGVRVRLQCGTAKATLLTLPVEDYPTPPPVPEAVGSVAAADLAAAVATVGRACSHDESLPMLTGIHLTLTSAGITAAATDRYRMSEIRLPWQPVLGEDADPITLLAPAMALTLAAKGMEGAVQLSVTRTSDGSAETLTLADENRVLHLRLLDAEFVKASRMLDETAAVEMAATATVDPAALRQVLDTVAVLAERNTPARISVQEGRLVVSTGSGEDASGSDVVDADIDGTALTGEEPLSVAFNINLLTGVLTDCRTERVRLLIHRADRPVLILPQDAPAPTRHLLMPVRLT